MRVVTVDGLWLMDREALAQWTGRSANTIRARCLIHSRDALGPLYDAHASAATLDTIPRRARRAA